MKHNWEVRVKLTREEYEKLLRDSRNTGLTISAFIRACLKAARPERWFNNHER